MNYSTGIVLLLGATLSAASGQVASHAPTFAKPAETTMTSDPVMHVTGKPVARVNGAPLTDRDLLREMMAMFPYAKIHNGFPKDQEASIRKGALEMIEYEELVYQEAVRRKMAIPPERLKQAEAKFRSQFSGTDDFHHFVKIEMNGSEAQLRHLIQRSLLIEALLKIEVGDRANVTVADARAHYEKNPKQFTHSDLFQFQTISIMPKETDTAEVKEQAHKRAEAALKQAQATHSFEEFGALAEKISEDDYRVKGGDHSVVQQEQLPPEVLKILESLKPGQMTNLCQFGSYYTIIRLQAHQPAGEVPFDSVKTQLMQDLQKARSEALRKELDRKLRANAKVEEL